MWNDQKKKTNADAEPVERKATPAQANVERVRETAAAAREAAAAAEERERQLQQELRSAGWKKYTGCMFCKRYDRFIPQDVQQTFGGIFWKSVDIAFVLKNSTL